MPEVSALDRLTAIADCEALMYEYADRIDHGAASTVCERVNGTWLFHRRDTIVAFKRAGEEFIRPVAS